jgi:hypothetical protein
VTHALTWDHPSAVLPGPSTVHLGTVALPGRQSSVRDAFVPQDLSGALVAIRCDHNGSPLVLGRSLRAA